MAYDEDYQPITKVVGVGEVNTGYEFPFTREKAEELHKLCKDKITAVVNSIRTQYIVQKYNEYKITVDSFKDFRDGDFETLYLTGNARGEEKPVMRPKTKKSKQQEQSDLQKEILKKQYTTISKPKEETTAAEAVAEVTTASIV